MNRLVIREQHHSLRNLPYSQELDLPLNRKHPLFQPRLFHLRPILDSEPEWMKRSYLMKRCIYISALLHLTGEKLPVRDSKESQDDQVDDIRVEVRRSWRSREITAQEQGHKRDTADG
jgi:hypothetical protein